MARECSSLSFVSCLAMAKPQAPLACFVLSSRLCSPLGPKRSYSSSRRIKRTRRNIYRQLSHPTKQTNNTKEGTTNYLTYVGLVESETASRCLTRRLPRRGCPCTKKNGPVTSGYFSYSACCRRLAWFNAISDTSNGVKANNRQLKTRKAFPARQRYPLRRVADLQ